MFTCLWEIVFERLSFKLNLKIIHNQDQGCLSKRNLKIVPRKEHISRYAFHGGATHYVGLYIYIQRRDCK